MKEKCKECNGTGKVKILNPIDIFSEILIDCDVCNNDNTD